MILDSPVMAPHKCTGCGAAATHDDRKYIDTGVDLEFYGVVYYCSICFKELAQQLDFVPVADLHEAQKLVRESTIQINQLVVKIEELQNDLDSCKRLFGSTPSTTSASLNIEPQITGQTSILSFGSDETGKSRTTKSSAKPRPKNIHGSTDES